jgi:glycine oxidase
MIPSSTPNPAENIYEVAIIGAGIIGLSAALALADSGLRVLALDQQQAMHEASWAAAGMLAANDPHNPPQMHALALYSESLYPAFLDRIHQLTGRAIPIRSTQTIEGLSPDHPTPGKPLTAEEIQQLAPGLNTGSLAFSLMQEKSLDPCDLTEILPTAIRAAGIALHEHTQLLRVEPASGAHRLIATHRQQEREQQVTFTAHHVLFATGAWQAPIAHAPYVEPRKGQLVALKLEGPIQTACTLRIPGLYIVPRGEGNYVVGATLENTGFDQSTSEEQLQDLTRRAIELWPPLARATRVAAWAGLRPLGPYGLPVIGPLSQNEKNPTLWVATGHFRNGILLAPGTAHVVRDLILGHKPQVSLDALQVTRLTETNA